MAESVWTLTNAEVTKTFADWGLKDLVKTTRSQAQDIVTFVADGAAFDAANLFAINSTCTIKKDGVQWFVGRVIRIPRAGAPASESMSYELAGPWWYLDNLVFQQIWKVTDGVTEDLIDTLKSRIILNQDLTGAKTTTGQQITEALNYAIAKGAPFQVGTISPSLTVPFSEVVDRSCAEIVKTMLRWTPDAVTWFDYSTSPPTLHIKQRADCASVSIAVAEEQLAAGINITPRYDLQVPAVVLKFEQENSVNDDMWTSVTVQNAGGTGDEFGALILTIQLGGAHVTYQSQKVKTQAISESDITWWKTKLKWLADATFTPDPTTPISGGAKKDSAGSPSTKPREIIEGACPSWKSTTTEEVQVTALLTGKVVTASGAEIHAEKQPISCRVAGTTLNTQTYIQTTSATPAEDIPVGMAASFYAALSVLQYEGTLTLVEEECGGLAQIGKLLNLTGALAAWTTMAAQIQGVVENVDSGTTQITFGPAEHLSPQDLIELLRANRERVPSWRLGERITGKASGAGGKVEGGQATDNENASGAPAPMKKIVLVPAGGGGAKFTADPTTGVMENVKTPTSDTFKADGGNLTGATGGQTYSLQLIHWIDQAGAAKKAYFYVSGPVTDDTDSLARRTVTVCDGGTEKTMQVIGTAPS